MSRCSGRALRAGALAERVSPGGMPWQVQVAPSVQHHPRVRPPRTECVGSCGASDRRTATRAFPRLHAWLCSRKRVGAAAGTSAARRARTQGRRQHRSREGPAGGHLLPRPAHAVHRGGTDPRGGAWRSASCRLTSREDYGATGRAHRTHGVSSRMDPPMSVVEKLRGMVRTCAAFVLTLSSCRAAGTPASPLALAPTARSLPTAAPSAPALPLTITVTEDPAGDRWRVDYELDQPVLGVRFERQRTRFRARRWTPRWQTEARESSSGRRFAVRGAGGQGRSALPHALGELRE
jgi:hypothetical protein